MDYFAGTVIKQFTHAIREGRKCVYVYDGHHIDTVYKGLKSLPMGEIDFYPFEEVYLENGRFSEDKPIRFWEQLYGKHQRRGLTIIGQPLYEIADFGRLSQYELEVDKKLTQMNVAAICPYHVQPPMSHKLQILRHSHSVVWSDCLSYLHLINAILLDVEEDLSKIAA